MNYIYIFHNGFMMKHFIIYIYIYIHFNKKLILFTWKFKSNSQYVA